MIMNQKYIYGYTCFSIIIAILILVYASIPKPISESKLADKSDLPETIDNVRVIPQTLYHSHVEKLVLLIIDGFGIEDFNDSNFPYVLKLIKRGDACFLPYKTQPFSTTQQKIKTLTSGSSNGFLDSILTLNSTKFSKDYIFRLSKENNLKISFLGLNTWSQLFPDYINIETLGNNNYSRSNYFTKDHWDWFVFHYQTSKNSEYQYPSEKALKLNNLRYLDDVIRSFHEILNDGTKHYTILILGDTGIRDLENPNEFRKDPNIFAPYIVIQKNLCLYHIEKKCMKEFDIAPMISVLTGLPIPASSYGSINLDLLFDFTLDEKLYVSYYITRKLMEDLTKFGATNFTDCVKTLTYLFIRDIFFKIAMHQIFLKAVTEHGLYLRSSEKNKTASAKILETYENLMNCLSTEINEVRMQLNVSIQFLSLILLIEALIIMLNAPNENVKNLSRNIALAFGFNIFLIVFILGLGICKRVTSFVSMSKEEAIVVAIIGIFMICNSYIFAKQKSFISIVCSALIIKAKRSKEALETLSSKVDEQKQIPPICTHKNSIFMVLVLGTILQSLSLLEFSFVKCEKWTWFFLWTSVCYWIITNKAQKMYANAFFMNRKKEEKFRDYGSQISIIVSILIMHRIILSYTEIKHWLQYNHNSLCASMCLFFGLMILAFVCSICYEPFTNKWEKAIICTHLIFTVCAIFALKVAEGKATFFYYPSSTGTIESILFWTGYSFGFVYGLVISTIKTCFVGKTSVKELITSGIVCCTMLMALQSSISHVILISMEILYSLALSDVLKNHKSSFILSQVWLGHLFFHYQQNYVLNLDDIQKTVETVSSADYYFIVRGLLSTLNFFSAPILAYFLCIHGQLNNNSKTRASENVLRINKTFICCQLMIIIAYALGMMFRSQSEWSWTFLCMKLLYEIVYIVILIIISVGMQSVVSFHDIILAPTLLPGIV